MKARAPQYGQTTLLVEVDPRDVQGDVREINMLGHYVGIKPMGGLARLEPALAPLGMLGAGGGLLLAPWPRRSWRLLVVLPAVLMPLGSHLRRPPRRLRAGEAVDPQSQADRPEHQDGGAEPDARAGRRRPHFRPEDRAGSRSEPRADRQRALSRRGGDEPTWEVR